MINIGTIDKSNFPEMRARIQVSSGLISNTDEFLTHMQFKDCNSPVDNLSVERLEYTTSRIILLCDLSAACHQIFRNSTTQSCSLRMK